MRGRQVEIPSSTSPMLKTRSALGVEHIRKSDAVCECSCLAGLAADLRARYSGRIKSFNASKGYGFISCDETSGPQWLSSRPCIALLGTNLGLEGKNRSTPQLPAEAPNNRFSRRGMRDSIVMSFCTIRS